MRYPLATIIAVCIALSCATTRSMRPRMLCKREADGYSLAWPRHELAIVEQNARRAIINEERCETVELEREASNLTRELECVVCKEPYSRERHYTYAPCCAHHALCQTCAQEWFVRADQHRCPHCNVQIPEHLLAAQILRMTAEHAERDPARADWQAVRTLVTGQDQRQQETRQLLDQERMRGIIIAAHTIAPSLSQRSWTGSAATAMLGAIAADLLAGVLLKNIGLSWPLPPPFTMIAGMIVLYRFNEYEEE